MAKKEATKASMQTNQPVGSNTFVRKAPEEPKIIRPVGRPISRRETFRGSGIFFPIVNNRRQKVKMDRMTNFEYTAEGVDMIAWCEKMGFEKVS